MEQGYKHFSHSHNLVMHQLPEGVDVSCSGCNSSGNGTVFICWQCNFFLHEQCYRATRSFKHPSHLPHPLTLIPYPTYPSNSFYCNSCEIIGTGFSYSCAHCEYDLHVQCAYSISRVTSFQKPQNYQTNYYNPDLDRVPPCSIGENYTMTHNINVPFVSVPYDLQHPITASHQYPYMDPNSHSTVPNYVSVQPNLQDLNTTAQNPSTPQNGHSISMSTTSPYPVTGAQYPSMAQTGPSVSIPTNSQDSVTGTQFPSVIQHLPSVPIPASPPIHLNNSGNPSNPQNRPSVSISPNSQNPIPSPQYPPVDISPVSIPTHNHDPMAQKIASVNVPNASPNNHVESGQNELNQNKGIKHFSHPHGLRIVNLQDEENEIDCSGCEETVNGNGYSCVEPNCDFHLHESCFNLKQQIQHNSHPEHPLTLLPLAPYNNENGEFTCNACFSDGTGFTYHCSICKYDLHIQCVSLPETMERSDHDHMLKLYYSCPVKDEDYTFSCDVCHVAVQKDRWVYYCESCDYGTHLGCVDCEECEADSILDTQMRLQRLQFQVEMSRQQAQMVASMGASLLSLV